MKFLLLIAIFSFSFNSFSQELENFPIDTLGIPCYHSYQTIQYDSIINMKLSIEIMSVDKENSCIPAEYKMIKTQTFPWEYHRFVHGRCADSIEYYSREYSVPRHCTYWVKLDSGNFMKRVTVSKRGGRRDQVVTYVDSIMKIDNDCVEIFYLTENDSIHSDTIVSSVPVSLDIMRSSFGKSFTTWTCNYFYNLKHGEEYCFYSISEIKNLCIDGQCGLLRYYGSWKYGKKHGKWRYYSKEGVLLKAEKYRNGKLKKLMKL